MQRNAAPWHFESKLSLRQFAISYAKIHLFLRKTLKNTGYYYNKQKILVIFAVI